MFGKINKLDPDSIFPFIDNSQDFLFQAGFLMKQDLHDRAVCPPSVPASFKAVGQFLPGKGGKVQRNRNLVGNFVEN